MRIAVFCGSAMGVDPDYEASARALATSMAAAGHELVFGGGRVGLMGVVADSALAAGGKVIGVMPQALRDREIQHTGLSELYVVEDMHQRKAKMAELADGFVALPGGVGTLEEIFEAWAWAQLGYHNKPCAFFNVKGYFDQLLAFVNTMVSQQFLAASHQQMLIISEEIKTLVQEIEDYSAPPNKWE